MDKLSSLICLVVKMIFNLFLVYIKDIWGINYIQVFNTGNILIRSLFIEHYSTLLLHRGFFQKVSPN